MDKNIYLIPLAGMAALAFTYMRAQWVAAQDPGTDRMKRIAGYILSLIHISEPTRPY